MMEDISDSFIQLTSIYFRKTWSLISGLETHEINEILSINENPARPVHQETRLSCASVNDELRSTTRFGESLNRDEINTLNKETTLKKNTIKRNRWAFKILEEWMKVRGIEVELQNVNNQKLCEIMASFVHEARRSDGGRYLGATLMSIVAGIQNTLSTNERQIDFLTTTIFDTLKKVWMLRWKCLPNWDVTYPENQPVSLLFNKSKNSGINVSGVKPPKNYWIHFSI